MNSQRQSIDYLLEERNTKQIERIDLSLLKIGEEFVFEGQNHFMGIKWCNKMGNFSYPISYHIEVSQLMYGIEDNNLQTLNLYFIDHIMYWFLMKKV
jgi:hypothetical protein